MNPEKNVGEVAEGEKVKKHPGEAFAAHGQLAALLVAVGISVAMVVGKVGEWRSEVISNGGPQVASAGGSGGEKLPPKNIISKRQVEALKKNSFKFIDTVVDQIDMAMDKRRTDPKKMKSLSDYRKKLLELRAQVEGLVPKDLDFDDPEDVEKINLLSLALARAGDADGVLDLSGPSLGPDF